MNFSEIFGHSGLVDYSKDSTLIAATNRARLTIYSASETEPKNSWNLVDAPSSIAWSPDSSLIMTIHPKRALILVHNVEDYSWSGRISMTGAGAAGAFWSPDSRSIIAITDY